MGRIFLSYAREDRACAQRTGLLAYWRSGRLPDFCRKDPEPICARLMR